jgi:S-adenosyl-L-methionine hydrolase (adenosine-forming)
VLHIDSFGNLSVNLTSDQLQGWPNIRIKIKDTTITGLARAFGDGQLGELLALIDSSGHLSVCVVNGSAAQSLSVSAGEEVFVSAAPDQ